MKELNDTEHTYLSGENGDVEYEIMKFFSQKMEGIKEEYKQQQEHGKAQGKKLIVKLSTSSEVLQTAADHKLEVDYSNTTKLSNKKVQEIFNQTASQYQQLKQSQQLSTKQEIFKKLIQVNVRCSRYLIKKPEVAINAQRIFHITQAMFIDYLFLFPDDRETLRLQLNFRDMLKYKGYSEPTALSSLLTEETAQPPQQESTDNQPTTVQDLPQHKLVVEQKEFSFEELVTRWRGISTGSMRTRVLYVELGKLSLDINNFIYQNPSASKRKQHIGLALTVEEFRIRQMQKSPREHIKTIAKSMHKSARYFKMLYIIYQNSKESFALKKEVKKLYLAMEERASNYEQMLACYFVEKSKSTSDTEKKNAEERRLQYKLEDTEQLGYLCTRYQELIDAYAFPSIAEDSFYKLSSKDKYQLLCVQVLNFVDFNLLQKARTYLTDIHCQFLAATQQESTAKIQEDALSFDKMQDTNNLPMHKSHLQSFLHSRLGIKLQEAIKIYTLTKTKYLEQLHAHHPTDTFITNEYFSADLRLRAYEYLFTICGTEDSLESLELIERNCWDIINGRDYASPILLLLARYKLDCIDELQTKANSESVVSLELQEIPKDLAADTPSQSKKENQHKSKRQNSKQDDATIWSQLCEAHVVTSICFSTYLEKIYAQKIITTEMAEYLYQAITDRDKPLVVDEHNIDMFFELFGLVVSYYFVPEEFTSLQYSIGKNIAHGNRHELVSDDKLMVKALDIHDEVLKFIRIYRPELQLKVITSQVEIFYKMRQIIPKREFLTRCEQALQDAQECIHLEQDPKVKLQILDSIKKTRQIVKNAHLQSDEQTCVATEKYMERYYFEKKSMLETKAENLGKLNLKMSQRIMAVHQVFRQHTLLLQIRSALHITLKHKINEWQKALPLVYAINAQLDYLTHLQYWHMATINNIYIASTIDKNVDNKQAILKWFYVHYEINLAYYAKISEIFDEERYAVQLGIITEVTDWLQSALDNKDHNFAIYQANISKLTTDTPELASFAEVQRRQLDVLDLNLSAEWYLVQGISQNSSSALGYALDKKYWQALYTLDLEHSNLGSYCKASILLWFYKIIASAEFASMITDNEMVRTSLAFTISSLKSEIESLINDAKREQSLSKSAKKLGKLDLSSTPVCGIFTPRIDEIESDSQVLEADLTKSHTH